MSKSNDKLLAMLTEKCRRNGLRATPQRLEIMRALYGNCNHPDVEWIFTQVRKRLPAISRNTVYRTLHQLEQQGVVARLGVDRDHAAFDAHVDGHHHFVCTVCGVVNDFESGHLHDFDVDNAVQKFGKPLWMRIEVRGVCCSCNKKNKIEN
jgi:Fur family peroxide stress response transcriptional regulator